MTIYKHKTAGTVVETVAISNKGLHIKILESKDENDIGKQMIIPMEDLDNGKWEMLE